MHTSLSKKLLAGLLSLVMVLSLVAPSMSTEAASKYSLTKKNGTTYATAGYVNTYYVKGVSKKQYIKVTGKATGVTVKYNGKTVGTTTKIKGTGKTLSLQVTAPDRADAYSNKITVKIYNAKTNKVVKTLTKTTKIRITTSVALDRNAAELTVGETLSLKTSLTPSISKAAYSFKSSNEAVATVDSTGVVAAVAEGTAVVTVTTKNGRSDSCIITVKNANTVKSVSQVNASQIEVAFNCMVNEDDLETASNYSVNGSTPLAAEEMDEKTVLLTVGSGLADGTHTVTVSPMRLYDNGAEYTAEFSDVYTFEDKTAPQIISVSCASKSDIADAATIYFSEPVAPGSVIKVDDKVVGTTGATSSYGYYYQTVGLTGLSIATGKAHTVKVVNLKDTSKAAYGNGNTVAEATFTFDAVKDTTAPVIESIEQYTDHSVLVTFSKKMNAASFAGAVKAYKADLTVIDSSLGATQVDRAGKQFVVDITGLTTYTTLEASKTVVLAFTKNIKDSLGNALTDVTKSITLTKDTTAPTVTAITYSKGTDGYVKDITLTYSEPVNVVATTVYANIQVVNSQGVVITNTNFFDTSVVPAAVPYYDNKIRLTVRNDGTSKIKGGDYYFTFVKGFVKDNAKTQNDSALYNTSLNFGKVDTTATFVLNPASVDSTTTPGAIVITYPYAMKGGAVAGSATDLTNYTLGGSALPTGTTATLDSTQKIVTITLGAGVGKSDSGAIFRIAGVQTLTGLTIEDFTKAISVVDNTAPVLTSALITGYQKNTVGVVAAAATATVDGKTFTTETNSILNGYKITMAVSGAAAVNVDPVAKTIDVYYTTGQADAEVVDALFDTPVMATPDTTIENAVKAITVSGTFASGSTHEATLSGGVDLVTAVPGTVTVRLTYDEVMSLGTDPASLGTGSYILTLEGKVISFTTATAKSVAGYPNCLEVTFTADDTVDFSSGEIQIITATSAAIKDVAGNGHKENVAVKASRM